MNRTVYAAAMPVSARLPLFVLLGGSLGATAGLWDLSSAALSGTLLLLALSGFALSAAAPKLALPVVLAIALGVLAANLVAPQPPGVRLGPVPRGLISAGVAMIPAGVGAVLGALATRFTGWRV